MKKFILSIFFVAFIFSLSFAQLPYTVTFEDGDPNAGTYVADANLVCGSTDYFGRVDDFDINGVGSSSGSDFAGEIGTHYWAGESHDDVVNGSPGTCSAGAGQTSKTITFGPIDISAAMTGIEVATMYAARQGTNWEGTEGMSMSYSFNNSTYTTGIFFAPVTTPDLEIREGGIESGAALTLNFVNFNFSFARDANTQLWLRFTATNEASSEELAIDQIVVSTFLPVELIDFSAKPMDQGVMLDWSTASEQNNDYFAIERSFDGQRFKEIGKVAGAGSTYTAVDYNFFDNNPPALASTLYYRLRQVDYDGKFEYSPIEVIDRQINGDGIQLWPNPVDSELNISLASTMSEQPVRVEIFDINGRLLRVADFDQIGDNFTMDTSELGDGIYLIKISSQQFSQTKRFIKQ